MIEKITKIKENCMIVEPPELAAEERLNGK